MYDRHGHRMRLCDPDWTEIEAEARRRPELKPTLKAPQKPAQIVARSPVALLSEGIPSYALALRSLARQGDALREEIARAVETAATAPVFTDFEHAFRSLRN